MSEPSSVVAALVFSLAVPAAGGWLAGRAGSRGVGLLLGSGLAALGLSVVWNAVPPPTELLGLWAVAGLVALLRASSNPGRRAAQLGVFFGCAEVGARLALPEPVVPVSQVAPWTSRHTRQHQAQEARFAWAACDLMHHAPEVPEAPWVLHLGDSMVRPPASLDAPQVPLAAAWAATAPSHAHVDRAAPGTSVDVQLLALRRALPSQPSAVVWYVNPFNDALEWGKAFPCCADGPVLRDDLSARCPVPTPIDRPLARTATPPWLLRAMSSGSHLAGWGLVTWGRWIQFNPYRHPVPWAQVARTVRAGVDEAQAAGVPVVVAVLPDLGHRLQHAFAPPQESALAEALQAEGIPTPRLYFPPSGPALATFADRDQVHLADPEGFDHLVRQLQEALEEALTRP